MYIHICILIPPPPKHCKKSLCLSELLKVEDMKTHVCAFFWEYVKFLYFNPKQEKWLFLWVFFFTFWHYKNRSYMFYGILCQFLCIKLSVWKFACAKELSVAYSTSPPEDHNSLSPLFLGQLGGILSVYIKHAGERREAKPLPQWTKRLTIFLIHLHFGDFVDLLVKGIRNFMV